MDSRFNGGNAAFRRATDLCGDLPVRGAGDDFCGFRSDFFNKYFIDAGPHIYAGATIIAAAWKIIELCTPQCTAQPNCRA